MSLELSLRGAIYAALVNDATVGALVGDRIFDAIPNGAAMPYVELGEVQAIDEDIGCGQWLETFVDLHVWSQAVGTPEAHRIIAAVRAALRGDLTLDTNTASGAVLHTFEHQSTRVMRGRDPQVSHGIVTFRANLGGEY